MLDMVPMINGYMHTTQICMAEAAELSLQSALKQIDAIIVCLSSLSAVT